jgi:hypothetical protein
LITIDPLVSSIDDEMLRRMSFLGYRCFGLTFDKLSDNIQSNAMKLGMRVIYWQQKKDVKDIEGILMRAQVVNTRFTLLKIPLNFRFQETKEYIRKNQSKIDSIALSFKEFRDIFINSDAEVMAGLVGRIRALLLRTDVGLLSYSEAAQPDELVSPVAHEYLLSLILHRNEPLASARVKRTYDKLLWVSV